MLKISSPRAGSGSAADAAPAESATRAPRKAVAAPRIDPSLALRLLAEVLVAAAAAFLAERAEGRQRRLGVAALGRLGQLLGQLVSLLRRRLEVVLLVPDRGERVGRRLVAALREHLGYVARGIGDRAR